MSDFGNCRSCRAPVQWALSAKSGKPMPLEHAPENGNVALDGFGRAHVFGSHQKALDAMERIASFPQGQTYRSHHATCPERGKWSRAPGRQDASSEHVQESLL